MTEERLHDEMGDPVISIGVLAQKVGLSVSAVRKYENESLIIAHRTDSGHRLFSQEDISRVCNIHRLIQDLGGNRVHDSTSLPRCPCILRIPEKLSGHIRHPERVTRDRWGAYHLVK